MYRSVEYSTIPRAFRGARAMSVITAFRGSFGSTSPNARPTIFLYGPVSPKDVPANVGDSTRLMVIFVMRASTDRVKPAMDVTKMATHAKWIGFIVPPRSRNGDSVLTNDAVLVISAPCLRCRKVHRPSSGAVAPFAAGDKLALSKH